MITAWRIVLEHAAEHAFTGEYAKKYGARWNSAGSRVVYAAESRALAALETLVQLGIHRPYSNLVLFSCSFEESLVDEIDRSSLPADWTQSPSPEELKQLGDRWLRSRRSAVLKVPSAVIEEESNYLLNTEHGDFRAVTLGEPRPFVFDIRLGFVM